MRTEPTCFSAERFGVIFNVHYLNILLSTGPWNNGIKICKDALKVGIYANKLFKESNLCEILPSQSLGCGAGQGEEQCYYRIN